MSTKPICKKGFLMAGFMVSGPVKEEKPDPMCLQDSLGEEKPLVLPWFLTMRDWQAVSCTALGKPLICQYQHL